MKLEMTQKQELKLTPQMLQSMEILQMSTQELEAYLQELVQENPAAELSEPEERPDEGEELWRRMQSLADQDNQNRQYVAAEREELERAVLADARSTFAPEFLNRLDEIVFYKPLTKDNVTHIIDLMAADLNRRLEDKQLTVVLTPAAKEEIIASAYDPIYGARPLRRYLQHTVETLISKKIIADQVEPGSRITVECRDGELTVDSREVLTGEVIDA